MSENLAAARSPFLQHGFKQPVRWMPFGDAAFARARAENKPMLLDIGAVWCHWCHVMDRESYEDVEIAALINENFIAVKVDRDERPDVDARYQRAVQTLTGQGGWPLTAFLTPDGETYYGGTYFPPTDGHGRPAFRRVLAEVARIWREEPQRARDAVSGIRGKLKAYADAETQPGAISEQIVEHIVEDFAEAFDFRFGGFGRAPKFPNSGGLSLLLDHFMAAAAAWSGRIVVETLDAMARGGIYDQIGGGFHRYATDARWLVPHFEKMAYDNGPLLEVYARAFAVTGSQLYADVVRGIVSYYDDVAADIIRQGGFPASQDADHSPNDDGDYWTWTRSELASVLTSGELDMAMRSFGLEDPGSAMHLDPERHVLYRAEAEGPVEIDAITAKLKRARDARPQPYVDKTVYSGWSALVTSGCIAAARHCGEAGAGASALRALDRIWDEAFDQERGISHRVSDRAAGEYLEDQAYVLQALVDAFELTQEEKWLARATTLADLTTRLYQDPGGAYRDRPREAAASTPALGEPVFPIADAPTPSPNGVIALSLIRMSALLLEDAYRDRAEAVLSAFGGSAGRLGASAATYGRAVDWFTKPVTSVVVTGRGAAAEEPLFQVALQCYRPRTILRYFAAANIVADRVAPEIRAMITAEAPRAFMCTGRTCAAPVAEPDALHALLKTFTGE